MRSPNSPYGSSSMSTNATASLLRNATIGIPVPRNSIRSISFPKGRCKMPRRKSHERLVEHVEGRARIGTRTKDLAKRIDPGEVAIINHADIDRVAADGLIAAGAAAVVNAAPSITGRYPNGGPIQFMEAGIPLIDNAGPEVMTDIRDGERIVIDHGKILVGGEVVASGTPLSPDDVTRAMELARSAIGSELRQFAINTLEYVREEAVLTFEPIEVPDIRTSMKGRHALVVVRGNDFKEDIRALKGYITEYHPVLIAVDGGADALLEAGLKADLIVGDFDSVSDKALGFGAELVAHSYRDGSSPGGDILDQKGIPHHRMAMEGTSEDLAMLLAFESGASLIVAVGTHASMVEFLDKGRKGMSSTFLTRLRLGPMLVDAKGVSRLYEGRVRRRDIAMLLLAATVAMLSVAIVSEPIQVIWDGIWLSVRDFWNSLTNRF